MTTPWPPLPPTYPGTEPAPGWSNAQAIPTPPDPDPEEEPAMAATRSSSSPRVKSRS